MRNVRRKIYLFSNDLTYIIENFRILYFCFNISNITDDDNMSNYMSNV